MLIVGFGKTFTIHDQAPKKLIMKTLARAAMENDQELEEEDTYWLRGDTPNGERKCVLEKISILLYNAATHILCLALAAES